jgi:triphosphoribosyl-dephospho-CoA synthase
MKKNSSKLSDNLSRAYKNACLAEVEALKPGNVHVFADGHGMTIHDFMKSADVTADIIAQLNLTVGERIFQSVEATQASVSKNTNLGIILLCAPIIHSALNGNYSNLDHPQFMRQCVDNTLNQLTTNDAILTAKAILLAKPGGLGNTNENDVHGTINVTLLELMASAQNKDRIAWQYTNNFSDIFEFGLGKYKQAIAKWKDFSNRGQNQAWATTALYLSFLGRQLDSHVVRKHGETLANQLMQEAIEMEVMFWASDNPKLMQKHLLAWDASLKSRNINPGTSADLTVACLFVSMMEKIV